MTLVVPPLPHDAPVPRPYATALAWALAAELCERHDDLVVLELHPASAQYDCLSVFELPSRLVCHMNLSGSVTHSSWFDTDGPRLSWHDVAARGPLWSAVFIEDAEDLPGPAKPTSNQTRTVRALAHLAAAVALRADTALRSAVEDSPYVATIRADLVEPYAHVCDHLAFDAGLGAGAYRWWFLTKTAPDGTVSARACLDTATAQVWFDPSLPPLPLASLPLSRLVGYALAALEG
jgi:hypothetical protein